jgi:hypothetical protein
MAKRTQTKVVPMMTRMLGHVPFHSIVTEDAKKGRYMASVKFNGKQFVGGGENARQATLDLRKQIDKAAHESKLPSTRVHDYDDAD